MSLLNTLNNPNLENTNLKIEKHDNDILVTIKHKNEIITFALTYDPIDKFDILNFKTTFTKNTIAKEQIYFAITELLLG